MRGQSKELALKYANTPLEKKFVSLLLHYLGGSRKREDSVERLTNVGNIQFDENVVLFEH
eukprot:1363835-Amorphochlora_amoeboformis.AAC.1